MKTDPKHPMVNTDEDLQNLNRHIVALDEKYNKPLSQRVTCILWIWRGRGLQKILSELQRIFRTLTIKHRCISEQRKKCLKNLRVFGQGKGV